MATVICVVSDGGAEDGAPVDGGSADRGSIDAGGVDRGVTPDDGDSGAPVDLGGFGGAGGTDAGAGGSGGGGTPDAGNGGAPGTGGTIGGGGDPTKDEGAACNTCTTMQCDPMTDGCDQFTDSLKHQRCTDLYACIRANHCAEAGDPTPCWCGTTPYAMCITVPGSANGACTMQVQDAADSQDPNLIKQRFVNPMFPVGGAVNLSVCRGSFCPTECR
jgi:hypothetical protein